MFIKEHENLTDERTVEFISENPYAQYFLGLKEFKREQLFDSSMMTHFRKRCAPELMGEINEALYQKMNPPKPSEKINNEGDNKTDRQDKTESSQDKSSQSQGGKSQGGQDKGGNVNKSEETKNSNDRKGNETENVTNGETKPNNETKTGNENQTVIEGKNEASAPKNKGKMILDATVAPSDVRYPTDLSLLNECRENTEEMIDRIWEQHTKREGRKTGYNRKKARAKYLKVAKQRSPRKKAIKKAIKEQLGYVKKNLETIEKLTNDESKKIVLPEKHKERLETIREVIKQQEQMLKTNTNSIEDRIVSLRCPHIRPIVRGKARTPVEFGQKLAFSVVDGFTFIDRYGFDNFNEGNTLIPSAILYKERFGFYPAVIQADMIYRNRDNRAFCKENGIRLSGSPLGRPKQDELEANKELAYKDSCERNTVESRNGIVKRRYGLDLITSRLPFSAYTEAAMNVFVMNAALILRVLLRLFADNAFKQRKSIILWIKSYRFCFLAVFQ